MSPLDAIAYAVGVAYVLFALGVLAARWGGRGRR